MNINLPDQLGYSMQHAVDLVRSNQFEEAKKYVKQYLYKLNTPTGFCEYNVESNIFHFHKDIDLPHFIPNVENNKFNLFHWWRRENTDSYKFTCNIGKPRIFINEQSGYKYINQFTGFKYQYAIDKKGNTYNSYPDDVKLKIDFIFNHLLEIWCSNNKTQYQYLLHHISNALVGNKRKKILFLKSSGQGAGKSIIFDFFSYILGSQLFCSSSDSSVFLPGKFNGIFEGKIMFLIEELTSESKNQWLTLGNMLKQYCTTDGDIVINKKNIEAYQSPNTMSIFINTNNNFLAIDISDRRYFILELNEKNISNTDYFDKLREIIADEKVQEAFFVWATEFSKKPYNDNKIPETDAKMNLIADNLPSHIAFLKDTYILNTNNNITESICDLYNNYVEYCKRKYKKPIGKNTLGPELIKLGFKKRCGCKKMVEIEIEGIIVKKPLSYTEYNCKMVDLKEMFIKKVWITDADSVLSDPIQINPPLEYVISDEVIEIPQLEVIEISPIIENPLLEVIEIPPFEIIEIPQQIPETPRLLQDDYYDDDDINDYTEDDDIPEDKPTDVIHTDCFDCLMD